MSTTINLLPDIRIAKIKAKNLRHLITGIAVTIWIAGAILIGSLFLSIGAQSVLISNANDKIVSDTKTISTTPNINEALTFQNKLRSLPGLYAKRTYYSKFMPALVSSLTPGISLGNISYASTGALTISGTASSIYTMDGYWEALKIVKVPGSDALMFSGMTNSGVSQGTDGSVGFSMTFNLNPVVLSQGK